MKKHLHKILAGVLVATSFLSMTGCSVKGSGQSTQADTNQKVPMGRYIENDLEFPKELEYITEVVVTKDGIVDVYGIKNNQVAKYSLIADGNWTKEEAAWLTQLSADGNSLDRVTYGANGDPYILYRDKEQQLHLAKVKADSTIEEIAIEWGEGYSYGANIAILPDGDILIGRDSVGLTRFDGKSGKLETQYDGMGSEFVVAQDKVMLIDVQNSCIVVNDLETGKELETIPYDGMDWSSKLLADEEGGIYLINSKGVSHLAPGGSVWENIIEGNLSSFGMPSLQMTEAVMNNTGEFIVAFTSQTEGVQLVKYSYDPDVATRPTTEVSIYMLEENMTMRQAAAEYQRNNPEVLVNLQIGMTQDDSVTKSDAIRTLNTELLAGKGPDLILLDGLSIESYIEKGVLLDMGEWASPAIEQGEWLGNIMKPYEKDGSVYALPTRFTMPTMWGNKEIIDSVQTLEELANWAKANPDKEVFYSKTPSQLIEAFYGSSAQTWLDENGQIKEDEFVKFLEAIETLADEEAEGEEADEMQELRSVEYLAYKDTQLHIQPVSGFMGIMLPYAAITQNGDADFGIMSNEQGSVFEPVGVVGINAKSEHQDIVKEIVQTALSEKVQDIELGDGFAVNAKSFEKGSTVSDAVMASTMMINGMRPINGDSPDQEAYNKLATYAKGVNVPATTDQVLLEMVIEETKGYFNGEKTAQEAASAVAKRTRAYLAE